MKKEIFPQNSVPSANFGIFLIFEKCQNSKEYILRIKQLIVIEGKPDTWRQSIFALLRQIPAHQRNNITAKSPIN